MGDIFKFNIKKECQEIQKDWFDDNITAILQKIEDDNLKYTSPIESNVFHAFKLFPLNETRILILGQDPYPDEKYPNKADGLAFSQNGQKPAVDSLKNIFEEIKKYKKVTSSIEWDTNLENWAKINKVLLLNTALTFNSKEQHFNIWLPFVKQIILDLISNKKEDRLAIFLWGVPAQQLFYKEIFKDKFKEKLSIDDLKKIENGKLISKEKAIIIDNNKIFITSHPCNRSKWRGFSTNICNHFKECDNFLGKNIDDKDTWLDFPENN